MTSVATWSDFELMVDALPTVGRGRYPQAIDEAWAPPTPPSDPGPIPVVLPDPVPIDELRHAGQRIRCKMHGSLTAKACLRRQDASGTREDDDNTQRWKARRFPECRRCDVGRAVRGRLGR